MKTETALVRFDAAPGDPHAPVSTPIYQTATFEQESALAFGRYDYTRSGNPTRTVLEDQLARLEGASRAFAFGTGMAALSTLARLVPAGGRILAGDDLYGGTYRLLGKVLSRYDVDVAWVDATDPAAVARAFETGPPASLVLVETPTNPLLRVVDVAAVAAVAHRHGALLAVDGSATSPYLQLPLSLGADVVVHSATKLLSGHADLSAGVLAVRDGALAEEIAFLRNAEGTALAPFEAWLLLRGMKTLALRVDRQQANAARIARFLESHPLVTKVHALSLDGHPGRETHARQARGAGLLVSFETGSVARSAAIVEAASLFSIAVSFGSVGSVLSLPCRMSHASIPPAVRRARSLPEDLVRVSAGIEDAGDLLADLAGAFARAESGVRTSPSAVG